MKKIYVTKPFLPSLDEYNNYLKRIWEKSILTNFGPLHEEFAEKLSKKFDSNISLFTNGHLALELAIKSFNFQPGSEVITTPFTFVSTTHAIKNNNLVPVFCDIKKTDYTIDEEKIEELINEKTCAILAVHVYGHPCNVKKINEIAKKHNLKVIYDAAHSFGVEINGKSILNYGDISMVSFHATKLFHTIEGGMIATKDNSITDKLHKLENFGITGPESVEMIGSNAKMNEFQAAMGLAIFPYIDKIVEKRRDLYQLYKKLLSDVRGILFVNLAKDIKYNYSYLPILIDENEYGMDRNKLFEILEKNDIYCRKYFYPCTSEFECYKNENSSSNLVSSSYVSERIMTLPLYYDLENEDVERICKIIKER